MLNCIEESFAFVATGMRKYHSFFGRWLSGCRLNGINWLCVN